MRPHRISITMVLTILFFLSTSMNALSDQCKDDRDKLIDKYIETCGPSQNIQDIGFAPHIRKQNPGPGEWAYELIEERYPYDEFLLDDQKYKSKIWFYSNIKKDGNNEMPKYIWHLIISPSPKGVQKDDAEGFLVNIDSKNADLDMQGFLEGEDRVKPDFQTKRVDTRWLGFLVLESLRKYSSDPETFGEKPRSFNKAMKPLFTKISQNSTRRSNLSELIKAYEEGPRKRVTKKIGQSRATTYLRRKGDGSFPNCVRDMLANRMIPHAVTLTDEPSVEDRQCRKIKAVLTKVHCVDDSEWSSDEPYLLTGASLFDSTGTWMKETECSDYAGNVDPGDDIDFAPESINTLFDWKIENPSDDLSLWPVSVLCTITLMEHDQSDKERAYQDQAFKAAFNTAKLLIAIGQGTAGGPVGIAIAVVSILISVLLALDGDDELGSVGLRFDNVLGDSAFGLQNLMSIIEGEHKDNYYKYEFSVQYRTYDNSCPVEVTFFITGHRSRTIPYMGGFADGGYALECPAPLDQIVWSVSPPRASISQQGERSTKISWHTPGNYVLSVSATDGNGRRSYYDEETVNVHLDTSTIPP